jgi:hypothetical protein
MKTKLLLLIFAGIITTFAATSQTTDADSIFVKLDSTFVDITHAIQNNYAYSKITINQSAAISDVLQMHISENFKNQTLTGYRICIYRDNQQNSRAIALQTRHNFKVAYPNIPTYWEYKNPYFYVYVGDFRTKRQAEKFKREINAMYPKSWVINETKINLPLL